MFASALAVASAIGPAVPAFARCDDATVPIETGFGAIGPHPIERTEAPNPAWRRHPVVIHHPRDEESAPWPVVFFAHGLGATDPVHYRRLVDHLASRGFAVVYSPYPTVAAGHERRYQVLWRGFEAGLAALGPHADVGRVGFLGHSYGGGATPFLAYRGLVERGWGSEGAFLMVLAPWYVLGVEPDALAGLPPHTRLAVQVYDRERINDHRIAIDLFDAVKLPPDQKLFVTLRSDEHGGCELDAGHTTPATDGFRGTLDALDRRGVFRIVDAVAADALQDDPHARELAFGAARGELADMGRWADGEPIRPLTVTGAPTAERPSESFRFRASARDFWIRADELDF